MLRIENKNKYLFKKHYKIIAYQENKFNIYITYCFIIKFIFIIIAILIN